MAEPTEDEILEQIHRLGVQKDEIRQEQVRLHSLLERIRAEKKLAEMPDAERQALLQIVQTSGIPSDASI